MSLVFERRAEGLFYSRYKGVFAHESTAYRDEYLRKVSETLEENETLYLQNSGHHIFKKEFEDCTVVIEIPTLAKVVYIKNKMDPVETYVKVLRRFAEAAREARKENQKIVHLKLRDISR